MSTQEQRDKTTDKLRDLTPEGQEQSWTRKTAPDVTVKERIIEPQDAMLEGDLDQAQKLIDGRLNRRVFDHATGEIRFTNQDLVGRWFNEQVSQQQIFKARQAGWLPTPPSLIADLDLLGVYGLNDSGHIVRGQRGEEHLMYMLLVNRDHVQDAKTQENDRRMGSKSKTKQELVEAAAAQFGAEAAEQFNTQIIGEVTDGVERIERRQE